MPEKLYAAGPRWRAVPGDTRREGDIIEEASQWPHAWRLARQRVLTEIPRGEWVYTAGRRYIDDNMPKMGEVVDVSGMDARTIKRLLEIGRLGRVDSADLLPTEPEPELSLVPQLQAVSKRSKRRRRAS